MLLLFDYPEIQTIFIQCQIEVNILYCCFCFLSLPSPSLSLLFENYIEEKWQIKQPNQTNIEIHCFIWFRMESLIFLFFITVGKQQWTNKQHWIEWMNKHRERERENLNEMNSFVCGLFVLLLTMYVWLYVNYYYYFGEAKKFKVIKHCIYISGVCN